MISRALPLLERFKYKVAENGCWIWSASFTSKGYGQISYKGKNTLAHRASAHLFLKFPIDSTLCVLHACDNPKCVNPAHLFIGTAQDNSDDMVAKGRHWLANKTHCDKGHPFSGENLYMRGGCRRCRSCYRAAKRKRYAEIRSNR